MDLQVRNIKKERNTNKNKKKGEKARMGARAAIIGAERKRETENRKKGFK